MTKQRKSQWSTTLLGLAVVLFTIALVVYPKQGFEAGVSGLKVFWDVVFPSLLPFFILSELMLGLGVVRGLGVILEPLMRPLFSVPGIGAFALSMGLAAGYPMDAVITARFREQNLCTRIEGERLLAFTNTADPLFMFGAVAVGMFKSPQLGALLAVAHYVSSFLVGVGFKFWGRKAERLGLVPKTKSTDVKKGNILKRAYIDMLNAKAEDNRAFGKLLYDAVTESIQTLLMICGFIVFFAVLIEVLHLSGLIMIIGWPIAALYHLLGIHGGLVNPTLAGFLEIDIGSAQTAAINSPLIQKYALVSAIIAWSGLSVHAQVASVLTQTDIRMAPYFLARFLHAVIAAVLTVVFYNMGIGAGASSVFGTLPAFAMMQSASTAAPVPWWHVSLSSLTLWLWVFAGLFILSLAFTLLRRIKIIAWRAKMNRA